MNKKKMKYLKTILLSCYLILLFNSCVPEMGNAKRLHRTFIKKEGIEVDWFYYSLIGNTTSDYITANNGSIIDTIMVSDMITDVYIKKDTIFIELYNKPSTERRNFKIPNKTFDYYIKVDSTEKKRAERNIPSFIDE